MFCFLADDDKVILKLCASLKRVETFFFALLAPLKFAKTLRTTKQQKKTQIVLQIYKILLGEKLLGRKKEYQLEQDVS
jgi:hypothetical protein